MTVDDLVRVYLDGYEKHHEFASDPQEFVASGLRDVVRALRGEFVTVFRREYLDDASIETFLSAQVVGMLDEILCDAGAEKVAGGSTREDEQSCNSSDGSSPATDQRKRMQRILDDQLKNQPLPPATDAAPAVCVWEKRGALVFDSHGWIIRQRALDSTHCPDCGLPVKFTEAK